MWGTVPAHSVGYCTSGWEIHISFDLRAGKSGGEGDKEVRKGTGGGGAHGNGSEHGGVVPCGPADAHSAGV